jgi:hypothetical protein
MVWSVVVGDKVQDIKFTRYGDKGYRTSLGEKELGIIFKPTKYRKGWELVIYYPMRGKTVKGFISRECAVTFMLYELGYYYDDSGDITDYVVFKVNMERND